MKARRFPWLALMVGTMLFAGCAPSWSSRGVKSLPTTDPCSPSPQQTPVFYDDTGAPSPRAPALAELELRQIIDKIADKTREPIWFIRVKPPLFTGRERTVIVYLVPQKRTPKIREGRAYRMWVEGQEIGIFSRAEGYIQVSKPDQTFQTQLTLPATSDLPFSRPHVADSKSGKSAPRPEEELIRIVDFVRQASDYRKPVRKSGLPVDKMIQEVQETPILRVGESRGLIDVRFGYQHGPVFGYGVGVRIRSTPTGYEVVLCYEWVS
jgi:hypothetical protein